MKKFLSFILALVMLLSLAACSDNSTQNSSDDDDDDDDEKKTTSSSLSKIDFEEMTVVDNETCTIKVTDVTYSKKEGYNFEVYLENKSEDQAYIFSTYDTSVNGVMTYSSLYTTLEARENATADLYIIGTDLAKIGVEKYTDVEVEFTLQDPDSYETLLSETVHIYPYGEDKAETYVRKAQKSDTVIVDNEYAQVIVTGYENDEYGQYVVNFYMVNQYDAEIFIRTNNIYLNQYEADTYCSVILPAGKVAFREMAWTEDDLEALGLDEMINGVEDFEEITFELEIIDWEPYDTLYTDNITLNP